MIKYSIITANYNGFNLMDRYFLSLSKQKLKDFEIIVIDDCSTDDSYKKLTDYKKKTDLNMKVLKTPKNSGPGVARNMGIDVAEGIYITFIDNDDWVDDSFLEDIDKLLSKKKYDCLIYDYCLDFDGKTKNASSMYGNFDGDIEKKDAIRYIRNHTVCKFYNSLHYPNIRRHEDIGFVGSVLTKCNTFFYLKKPYYHYVQHKSSLSRNKVIDESTLKIAYKMLEQNYKNDYFEELKEKSVMDLLYSMVLIMCKNKRKNSEIKKFIKEYNLNNKEWYKYEIINYIGKSKKIFLTCIRYRLIVFVKLLAFIHTLLGG